MAALIAACRHCGQPIRECGCTLAKCHGWYHAGGHHQCGANWAEPKGTK